jgi:signal transduction histidine kinase
MPWSTAAHTAWVRLAMAVLVVATIAAAGTLWRTALLPTATQSSALVHITQAQRTVQPASAQLEPGAPFPAAALQGAAWQEVALPDVSPRPAIESFGGPREYAWDWYRMVYPVAAGGGAAPPLLAVYVPRVAGGAVRVYADGQLLLDNLPEAYEQWNRPVYVSLAATDRAQREIVIGVLYGVGQRGRSMSSVWIGPQPEVKPMYDLRRALQITLPQVTTLTILLLGLFALGFWWRRKRESGRSEGAYLLFGVSALVWWLRNLHYYVDMPADPTAYAWFWWATHASLAWIMALTYLFALRMHDLKRARIEKALVLFVVAMSILTLPIWPWKLSLLVLQHTAGAAVSLLVMISITRDAWQLRVRTLVVLTVMLWLGLVIGVHDLLLVAQRITPESIYLMPYGTLLIFGAFLYAVQRRYFSAISEVEQANLTLETRLAQRQAQLEASWQKLRQAEREQAVLRERQRLMRDMHDGVGSALMSSLVLVEQGQLAGPAVAVLLRECMDDIKLVIDSMEPVDQDLVALLASLRYRLGRRMELAGVELRWDVRELPRLPWLDPGAALQVLRIVQETLTNVLKHAGAQTVTLATTLLDKKGARWVRVSIIDDGAGFDVAAMQARGAGRGLRNLKGRARTLHGELEILSEAGRTAVTLDLPVEV